MSDDQDKDSKTESPTEKKMTDAMEKGNTPFSREVTMFASVVAIYIFVVFFLPTGFATVAESLKDIFEQPEAWRINTSTDVVALISHLFWKAGTLLIPFFVLLIVFGIGSSILQNLPSPVLDRVAPKMNRISPVGGFKRIYGIQGIVEFAKAFAKVAVVSLIIVLVLWNDYYATLDSMFSDPLTIFATMSKDFNQIMIVILIATAVIAIAAPLVYRADDDEAGGQGRTETVPGRPDHPCKIAFHCPRQGPQAHDYRGSARHARDCKPDALCRCAALCARRRRCTGGRCKGAGPCRAEDSRDGGAKRHSRFRRPATCTLNVCASLGG
jgi:hypothetical protein